MKYRLYKNATNDTSDVLREVLRNRGIEKYSDYLKYMNLDSEVVLTYKRLNWIVYASELFMRHFDKRSKIYILVDEDPDGFCSAAMMYLYIKRMDCEYPVDYIMHTRAKAHGLSDDVVIPEDAELLIIPDAGTNDVDECKELKERGIDILILDHHEKEKENPYAVIINNQSSNCYENKNLCGAGVVYRFLQALDDETWNEYADDYLDLCALANISDVMDMRSFETRYFTNTGLLNINNKCFKALIDSQNYSMNDKINIHNIQWYITPILNGCIRFGTQEEKELLFRAFIEKDEYFEYKKRATKDKPSEIVQESIYERAARLCKNAKSRQDKQKEKSVKEIAEIIGSMSGEDKVIIVDTSDILESGLTGVVAIKIAEIFKKPCILLNKFLDKKTNKIVYGGSARNINNSPIESFKDIVNKTGVINGQGHSNAFGIVNLDIDKKNEALKAMNELLKDIEYDSTYNVDFILDVEDVDTGFIYEISKLEDVVCQGIEDAMVAVENISLTRDCFEIFGKNEDTISFTINDIKYVQFRCKEGNKLYDFLQNAWDKNDTVEFHIVGKPSINEYNGVRTPQIIIEDILVTKESIIDSDNNNEDW